MEGGDPANPFGLACAPSIFAIFITSRGSMPSRRRAALLMCRRFSVSGKAGGAGRRSVNTALTLFNAKNNAPVFKVHAVDGQRKRLRHAAAGVKKRAAECLNLSRRVHGRFE